MIAISVAQITREEAEKRWYSDEGVYITSAGFELHDQSILHKHSQMKDSTVTFDRIVRSVTGGHPVFFKPVKRKEKKEKKEEWNITNGKLRRIA